MIFIRDCRILKLKSALESCLHMSVISARELASITGQIISMSSAVGNITRLLTESCYLAIEKISSWDNLLCISSEIRRELSFWVNNIDSISGRQMIPKSTIKDKRAGTNLHLRCFSTHVAQTRYAQTISVRFLTPTSPYNVNPTLLFFIV